MGYRYWFSRALKNSQAASWPEEAVYRTKFHLAQAMHAIGKDETEAEVYRAEATAGLRKMMGTEPPVGLKSTPSESLLFDHAMPVDTRFTGVGLLDYVE